MADREAEMARTEAVFREVNERIAETATRFAVGEATFVCECADPDCGERIDVPMEEYERVRGDATHFLLCSGHAVPSVERVVRRRRGYEVVEKFNAKLARIVRRLDPRAGDATAEPA
jgi:hypothetical protein